MNPAIPGATTSPPQTAGFAIVEGKEKSGHSEKCLITRAFVPVSAIMCLYQIGSKGFTFGIQSVYILLLEDDCNTKVFQPANRLDRIERIPCPT